MAPVTFHSITTSVPGEVKGASGVPWTGQVGCFTTEMVAVACGGLVVTTLLLLVVVVLVVVCWATWSGCFSAGGWLLVVVVEVSVGIGGVEAATGDPVCAPHAVSAASSAMIPAKCPVLIMTT
ncbi:hypothetical protein GCM10029964_073120 [Kibdelosporangium lantanae]